MRDLENVLIKTYMYERKKLQKSKYKKRETVYVYKCLECPNEIHLRGSDIKKVSGFCFKCSLSKSGNGLKARIRPYEALFNIFKHKTKMEEHSNNITYDEFLQFTNQKKCHYCYDSLFWTEFNVSKNGSSYNLDRKNNDLGYTKDNCVPCCWKCNESKGSNYTYEQWFKMTVSYREAAEQVGQVFVEQADSCDISKGGACGT